MTVRQLMDALSACPPDLSVCFPDRDYGDRIVNSVSEEGGDPGEPVMIHLHEHDEG